MFECKYHTVKKEKTTDKITPVGLFNFGVEITPIWLINWESCCDYNALL